MRKRIYVTNQCCNIRRAVFADTEIGGELPRDHGDYDLWPYGIRETLAIFNGTHPNFLAADSSQKIYMIQTASKVLYLIDRYPIPEIEDDDE